MLRATLFMTLLFSQLSFAEEMSCNRSEGSIVYASATTLNHRIVIVSPRVMVDNEPRLIASWTGDLARKESGMGLCRALGYKGGLTGDVSPWMRDTAERAKVQFDVNGKIVTLKRSIDYFIENVTCEID